MQRASWLESIYLAYVSRPKADRWLFRHSWRHRPERIVEWGIGSLRRSVRMIRLAAAQAGSAPIHYTAIDAFDSRSSEMERLTLKQAYCRFKVTGARLRLVPAQPLGALQETANSLAGTDLLIVSALLEPRELRAAWYYVPRMLHRRSLVLREVPGSGDAGCRFQVVSGVEIERLAATPIRRAA